MDYCFEENGIVYKAVRLNRSECVWRLSDMEAVLNHSNKMNRIIIGGKIFSKRFKRLIYGWNYPFNHRRSYDYNVKASYQYALDYFNEFIDENCLSFYFWYKDAEENSWSKF